MSGSSLYLVLTHVVMPFEPVMRHPPLTRALPLLARDPQPRFSYSRRPIMHCRHCDIDHGLIGRLSDDSEARTDSLALSRLQKSLKNTEPDRE